MFQWGKGSLRHRDGLHLVLQALFDETLRLSPFDLSITDSHRGQLAQDKAFADGASKLRYPDSKHNEKPARAGHLDPYPIDYDQPLKYYVLAGVVWAAAYNLGYTDRVRYGGDWDRDHDYDEETFRDLAHWEVL